MPFDKAEARVVQALKEQLPAQCIVVPDVRWAEREANYPVRDGQADVVVLWPRLGVLVLEVKGSREIRVGEEGWERLERDRWVRLDRDPVEQACGNAYKVMDILTDRNRAAFPAMYGWLAVYPNGRASEVPRMFDHTTLATRDHMGQLASKVRAALEARRSQNERHDRPLGFTEAMRDRFASTLTSADFRIMPADGAEEVADDIDAINALTRQQFAALQGLFEFPSVAIVGPAGSGKTVLALWRMQAVIAEGGRALYVCFNNRLAEDIRLKNPDIAEHVHSVSGLFGQLCPGLNAGPDGDHFFQEVLPLEVDARVSTWHDDQKYDLVVCDEAQDLSETQIITMHAVKKKQGSWAIFMDKRQDVYVRDTEDTWADITYRLRYNCRNTTRINSATNRWVRGVDVASMPGMPEGLPVLLESIRRDQMANRAMQIAAGWKAQGAASIAILSPYQRRNSAMSTLDRGHGLDLVESLQGLQSPGQVFFSTVKSFKGIEADCIILVDATTPDDRDGSAFRSQDFYVACTRAKTRLAILSTDPTFIAYLG